MSEAKHTAARTRHNNAQTTTTKRKIVTDASGAPSTEQEQIDLAVDKAAFTLHNIIESRAESPEDIETRRQCILKCIDAIASARVAYTKA